MTPDAQPQQDTSGDLVPGFPVCAGHPPEDWHEPENMKLAGLRTASSSTQSERWWCPACSRDFHCDVTKREIPTTLQLAL